VQRGRPRDLGKENKNDLQTQVFNHPDRELDPYFICAYNTVGGNVILYIHTTLSPPGFEIHHLALERQSYEKVNGIYNSQWFPIKIEGLCL